MKLKIKFIYQNWNSEEYTFLSFAFFLFRLFAVPSFMALFAQDPNPDFDFDKDPNVFAAGDLKLNFKGLYFVFFG